MRTIPTPKVARGGTRLGPALEVARELLAKAEAQSRVAVVVTDGELADAEALGAGAKALGKTGVRVVIASLSEDTVSPELRALADLTQGRVLDGRRALTLTPRGVIEVSQGDLLSHGGPVAAGPGWSSRVGGIPPEIEGRVRVSARAGARVLARVEGEPLLAEWSVGNGRVIGLASDEWALSGEQWSALLSPASSPRSGQARIQVVDDRLRLLSGPLDPPPMGLAQIIDEQGGMVTGRWRPEGPGVASMALPRGEPGVVTVVTPTVEGALIKRVARGTPVEQLRTGPAQRNLRLLAESTGGKVLGTVTELGAAIRARQATGGVPIPVLAALLALLFGMVEVLRWAGAWWRPPAMG